MFRTDTTIFPKPELWQSTKATDDDLERKAMERVIEAARLVYEELTVAKTAVVEGCEPADSLEEALTVLDGIRELRKPDAKIPETYQEYMANKDSDQ